MIVVTGGAGFIGCNLVKGLNQRGKDNILIVDHLGTGDKFKNLNRLRFSDYDDKSSFLDALIHDKLRYEKIDAVFHLGACSDTMETDSDYIFRNNLFYSKELLHFCLTREIPFIYASSASVYGDGRMGFTEQEECEGALNYYAWSKLTFDKYVRSVLPQSLSKVVGLRYFNVFGPNEFHKGRMASVVYHFYQQLQKGEEILLFSGTDGYADGEQMRDFIYVNDVVNVNLFFYDFDAPSGIYNCGTGRSVTYNQVASSVIKALGRGQIKYIDFPDALRGKYQNYTQADIANLRGAGFMDEFTGLDHAVQEYMSVLNTHFEDIH